MRVNTEVTLAMVNDHHSAITRKALGENDFALLYGFNFLTDWGFDINSFAKHFGGKLWMSNFAETTGYFASNWPIEFSFQDRKSTRLNSSHLGISYAVFCLKKKKKQDT